jgi:hypothetical protein
VTLVVVLFAFAVAVRMLASPALSVAGLAVFFVG